GDNAGQVGDNAGRDRISSISNVHRSEIHSEYIKSCFCTAPENSCQVADEAVGSEIIRMRYVQHHPAGRSAAQGFKQCHGKGIDKVCVNAEEREHAADSADDIIQGTRCTKNANAYKHGDKIGDDLYGGREALFGTFDKRLEQFYFAYQAKHQEAYNKGNDNKTADQT